MNEKKFYKKWEINHHNNSYYKKIFPKFILENGNLDFTKLDKEFTRRYRLKEYARNVLLEAKGIDIHECFSEPYSKEKACSWLVKLYMQPICEKSNKKLIEKRTIIRIRKVLKHYKKGKNKCTN